MRRWGGLLRVWEAPRGRDRRWLVLTSRFVPQGDQLAIGELCGEKQLAERVQRREGRPRWSTYQRGHCVMQPAGCIAVRRRWPHAGTTGNYVGR